MLQRDEDVGTEGAETPRFRPLDVYQGSLAARTYDALREAILTLRCRPGERLRKDEICTSLGVSRSPVAEAIARLSGEGMVDVVPQAGTFVARFSMDEIREGAFLREALELAAVEQLAPEITDTQLMELRRNLRVQKAAIEDGDAAGFYIQDGAFHQLLLNFTGYRRLVQAADTAWLHVDRARQLVLPLPGRVDQTYAEHEAIVAALEAHDPDAARQAMRVHLRQLIRFLAPLEREYPEFFALGPRSENTP